jgi:phosphatidylglycerol:prolipoprotein diacylglycerol transferase
VLFAAVRFATHKFKALAYPGRASAVFAIGYGLSRIVSEFFREPDAHIGYLGGMFTMGMLLSLPLLAVGTWLALRSRKFDVRNAA